MIGTIPTHIESRRHRRKSANSSVQLIWKDDSGQRRFEYATAADFSQSGAGIASPQPLAISSSLILRAPGMGAVALAQVRNCLWRHSQYFLGIEFIERAAIQPANSAAEPDHHELLRIGIGGEIDQAKLDRLYRSLASRYHPDNADSGDVEIFRRIAEAYRILSVPQTVYEETQIAKPVHTFNWKEGVRDLSDKRIAVLAHLYQRRLQDFRNAAISQLELESLTRFSSEEAGLILWYLREKGAVSVSGDFDYAITATGMDILEAASRT